MPEETQTDGAEVVTTDATQVTETQETPWTQKIWDAENPGKLVAKWQEYLPESLENAKHMLANYGDMETLLKSFKENKDAARAKAGVKRITEESTPDQIAAYRREMGIPDVPYEFQKPEQLPEGVEWREDRIKNFGEWAQKENLTPAQAKKALDLHVQYVAEDQSQIREMQKREYEAGVASEKEHLRTNFGGKLASVVNNAQRVALMYQLPPDIADPDSPKFGGVTMLKMMNDLAGALGESKIPSAAAVSNMSPEREYRAIVEDKSHPLHALWAKGDKVTLAKVSELRKQALYGGMK